MEQVSIAPAESETLVKTRTTSQFPNSAWWYMNIIQSSNGNRPNLLATDPQQEIDEDDSWESEGWRYIETTTVEGQVTRVRVPLTRYELLHPQEDYVIVHKTPHGRNTTYISNTVGTHLTHNPKAFVFDDVRVDFNLLGAEPVSPDISVVFDVSEDKDWGTFECQEEGVYPSVVFEITSPGTRKSDFGEKHDYYRRAGVPYYVILDIIYDKNKRVSGYQLFVFELSDNQYVEMQPDHQGRYWLPPLSISVGIGDKGILCYDALGNLLMSHEEVTHAFNESKKERIAEQKRADEQERIAEQERQLAQQEAVRADEQERIAQQETARATEQERIAEQERLLAQQEAVRADEQERIAQQEAARAAEQERIAEQERLLAQQEAARAAEQERIAEQERLLAQQEAARADEQERIAQQEAARAAEQERIAEQERLLAQQEAVRADEQERIANEALQAQLAAEARIAKLLARMAELEGES